MSRILFTGGGSAAKEVVGLRLLLHSVHILLDCILVTDAGGDGNLNLPLQLLLKEQDHCCWEVMFLHLSVNHSVHSGAGRLPNRDPLNRDTPGQKPPWTETPLDRDLLDRDPPGQRTPWPKTPLLNPTGKLLLEVSVFCVLPS